MYLGGFWSFASICRASPDWDFSSIWNIFAPPPRQPKSIFTICHFASPQLRLAFPFNKNSSAAELKVPDLLGFQFHFGKIWVKTESWWNSVNGVVLLWTWITYHIGRLSRTPSWFASRKRKRRRSELVFSRWRNVNKNLIRSPSSRSDFIVLLLLTSWNFLHDLVYVGIVRQSFFFLSLLEGFKEVFSSIADIGGECLRWDRSACDW